MHIRKGVIPYICFVVQIVGNHKVSFASIVLILWVPGKWNQESTLIQTTHMSIIEYNKGENIYDVYLLCLNTNINLVMDKDN